MLLVTIGGRALHGMRWKASDGCQLLSIHCENMLVKTPAAQASGEAMACPARSRGDTTWPCAISSMRRKWNGASGQRFGFRNTISSSPKGMPSTRNQRSQRIWASRAPPPGSVPRDGGCSATEVEEVTVPKGGAFAATPGSRQEP